MKSYFVRIYFNGNAVTGFFIPSAKDEQDALKQVKKMLILRLLYIKKYEKNSFGSGELSKGRVKSFLRSIKRPWRIVKSYNREFYNFRKYNTVQVSEWSMPIYCGAWISNIVSDTYLCNMK